MATVTTTIRVEKDLKDQATKLAKNMGLTFNIVMNNYLKRFVEEKEITFSESNSTLEHYLTHEYDTDPAQEFDSAHELIADLHHKRALHENT